MRSQPRMNTWEHGFGSGGGLDWDQQTAALWIALRFRLRIRKPFRGAIHLLVEFVNGYHVLVYVKLGAFFLGRSSDKLGSWFGVRARARVGRLNCRFGAVGNICRCFATLTFPLDGFLGLVSEAFAWHCFAIQSQSAAPFPLSFSRNATPCTSLGCQSEVTSQNAFAKSQRDGMCHRTNRRIIRNGFL